MIEMTMEKDDSDIKKVVRFSKMSTMVAIPHSERSWYSNAENSLFRELFARSVDDLRIRVSRGEVGCEIVGLEKHLTRDLSKEYHERRLIRTKAVIKKQQRYGRGGNRRWKNKKGSKTDTDAGISKFFNQRDILDRAYLSQLAHDQSKWAMNNARTAALLLERDLNQCT